jgi:hypothetical protein
MIVIAPRKISHPASVGMHRLLDGKGTQADLIAYRAWITWCRLHGDDDETLSSAIRAAEKFERQLEHA